MVAAVRKILTRMFFRSESDLSFDRGCDPDWSRCSDGRRYRCWSALCCERDCHKPNRMVPITVVRKKLTRMFFRSESDLSLDCACDPGWSRCSDGRRYRFHADGRGADRGRDRPPGLDTFPLRLRPRGHQSSSAKEKLPTFP